MKNPKKTLLVILIIYTTYLYSQENENSNAGYNFIVETGLHIGITEYGPEYADINLLNGYKFNEFISVNIGTGVLHEFSKYTYIPIYIDLRANFIDNKVSPVINIAYGKILKISEAAKNSPLFKLGFGVSLKKQTYIILNYNWQQKKSFELIPPYTIKSEIISASSIGVNLGFVF